MRKNFYDYFLHNLVNSNEKVVSDIGPITMILEKYYTKLMITNVIISKCKTSTLIKYRRQIDPLIAVGFWGGYFNLK